MTDYRLYFLDPAGHIERATLLDFATDQEALAAAREQADGVPVELWQRDRFVARFGPVNAQEA